ncbi:MAG: helix-turn-helix domain-containing protein [Christensenellales bacterium]|jgi:putative transcriptional regulator
MKKEDFNLLTESLQQAIDYKRGNKKAARSMVRAINVPDYKAADIVAVRRKLNLTQRGLANAVGVSPRTVEAWEAGINQPSGSSRHMLYLLDKDECVLDLLRA